MNGAAEVNCGTCIEVARDNADFASGRFYDELWHAMETADGAESPEEVKQIRVMLGLLKRRLDALTTGGSIITPEIDS